MATEPIQAGPYPVPSDAPDGPNQLKAVVDWAAPRLNMRFATTAARDVAIAVPAEGMECVTGTGAAMVKWLYRNGAWLDWTPRPEGAALTLGTGYTAIGGGYAAAMAYKSPGGLVTVQGIVRRTGATITAGASGSIATLPVGYRPNGITYFICSKSTATVSIVAQANGDVSAEAAGDWTQNVTYVSLAFTFQAA